jgi:hypothetical protein
MRASRKRSSVRTTTNAARRRSTSSTRRSDVTKIPPTAWQSFTGGERAGMRAYAEKLAKGEAIDTDYPTYYSLMSQAGTDPTTFANANLLSYRAKLGDTEFKQLADIQLAIRNKDMNKADKDLGDFRTKEQLVNDALTQYGIETREAKQSDEQKQAIAQLRRMVDVRTSTQANLTGKKPTNQDVQAVLDQILGTNVTQKGSWWGLWPGGGPLFDRTKPIVSMTIQDVPAAERTQIEAALRRRGRAVTDATILDLYIDQHSRAQK